MLSQRPKLLATITKGVDAVRSTWRSNVLSSLRCSQLLPSAVEAAAVAAVLATAGRRTVYMGRSAFVASGDRSIAVAASRTRLNSTSFWALEALIEGLRCMYVGRVGLLSLSGLIARRRLAEIPATDVFKVGAPPPIEEGSSEAKSVRKEEDFASSVVTNSLLRFPLLLLLPAREAAEVALRRKVSDACA